ncbi:ribbon-helix-helix protein, CopG family [Corynebacterium sp. TA-R-1]|uniref:Ribbon-helix-helix protein, CopG family n=1 Tax=Corynebacterium stercoris TaxID=2943490 RepID=A0ABT1G3J6_9CORY|nr:ribbon-helix-helix protein, CopG family [Corynebacterium stercoris]MCP1388602.1 ribbon-helix-helix protein, CopG family [Corynebacterium stercoris]
MPVRFDDSQLEAWVAEAEAGYDVEVLKERGKGRPGRGAEPSQVIGVRLTQQELLDLDAAAEKMSLTRSEIMREAIARFLAA